MTITVRLPAEQGALVVQAIHAAVDAQRHERDGADREREEVPDVSAETSRSRWDGSLMDLDMAVGGLLTLNGRG